MKKLLIMLLVLTMMACMVACGESKETNPPAGTTQPTQETEPTKPTEPQATTKPVDTTVYNYKVRVVDQDGNPIEGAYVMFCLTTCNFYATDAEGWALIDAEITDGYQAKIMSLPEGYEGYTFSEEYTNFESGQTEMTLVATKP